jgi:uncharacterized protein (DUF2141 family)
MIRFYKIMFAISLLPVIAQAADLIITVKGVRSSDGAVFVAVYDSESSFMKPPLAKAARKLDAKKGELKIVIPGLPAGKYAVASYHDENNNGKLDTNALGMPEEGYGFSNDARGTLGPPRFTEAAFDFDGKADRSITFSIGY